MAFKKYPRAVKVLVAHKQVLGKTNKSINQELHQNVSISSFRRWKILFRETHAILMDKAFYDPLGAPFKLLNTHRAYIRKRLDEDPTLFLAEIKDMLETKRGVVISISALSVEIREHMELTVKIARTVHPNQSPLKRGRFLNKVSFIRPESMVFIGMFIWALSSVVIRSADLALTVSNADESSVALRKVYRKRARARIGERTARLPRETFSRRFSLSPAISLSGCLALSVQMGSILRVDLEHYLRDILVRLFSLSICQHPS